MIERVMSGGQTGVDRAALDAALETGRACGGWCPKGRKAEDGPIEDRYPLRETPSEDYAQRTEWNVRDADATLVVTRGRPTGGTALTIELATRLKRPCLVVNLTDRPVTSGIETWIRAHNIRVLNIAGPRERTCPGIYTQSRQFLTELFALPDPAT